MDNFKIKKIIRKNKTRQNISGLEFIDKNVVNQLAAFISNIDKRDNTRL